MIYLKAQMEGDGEGMEVGSKWEVFKIPMIFWKEGKCKEGLINVIKFFN